MAALKARQRLIGFGIVVLAIAGVGAGHAEAGAPADRMPAGSVLYFEWAGADAFQAAARETPFGRLMADPGVARLIEESVRAAGIAIRKQAGEEGSADVAEALMRVLETIWRRPAALSVSGLALSETGPTPEAVFLVEVGDADKGALFVQSFERLARDVARLPAPVQEMVEGETFKRMEAPGIPVLRYALLDSHFVLTIGNEVTAKALASFKGSGSRMSANEGLAAARAKIGTAERTTWMTVHLDFGEFLTQARRIHQGMTGAEQFPPMVEGALKAASLDRLKTVTGLWQIAEGGFRETWFAALPPLEGRPKWMHQTPLTDEDLAIVPQDVTFAKVANSRLSDFYDGFMHVVSAIGPQAQEPVSNGLAQIEGMMGLRVKEDILDLLDDGFAGYISPGGGGLLFTGLTVMAEARDAEGVSRLLGRLVRFIGRQSSPEAVSIGRREYKGRTIEFASISGLPVPIAPAWCACDRHVIIGLYPQTVMRAVDHLIAGDRSRSLLANADFVRARKRLPESYSAIVYTDTKRGMSDGYRVLMPALTAGIAWARQYGAQIDAGMIPSYETFVGGMYGHATVLTSDRDGVRIVHDGPLPAPMLVTASGPAYAMGMAVSIAIPAFAKARERAEYAKQNGSLANVKAIMTACHYYAKENAGRFPPRLETLVHAGGITEAQLHSPRDGGAGVSYVYSRVRSGQRWGNDHRLRAPGHRGPRRLGHRFCRRTRRVAVGR